MTTQTTEQMGYTVTPHPHAAPKQVLRFVYFKTEHYDYGLPPSKKDRIYTIAYAPSYHTGKEWVIAAAWAVFNPKDQEFSKAAGRRITSERFTDGDSEHTLIVSGPEIARSLGLDYNLNHRALEKFYPNDLRHSNLSAALSIALHAKLGRKGRIANLSGRMI